MKKSILAVIGIAVGAVMAHAALDTSLTYHDQVLAAQAPTLEMDNVLLVGPASQTNGQTVAGSDIAVTTYVGKGLLVAGLGARSGAGHTSTVSVAYGFAGGAVTNPISGAVFTQTTATAKFETLEIDFDTLKGTNAALYLKATFANVAGDENPMIGSASVVRYKARAALQTITGSAVDTINYKGAGTIVVSIGAPVLGATNFAGTVAIQSSANGSTSWAAVSGKSAAATGNAAGAVTEIPYEFGAGNRYIRAVYTTTNDVAPVAVTLNSFR